MRILLLAALSLAAVPALETPTRAQPPGGPPGSPFAGPRPAQFGNYLNLTRQGASPAVNYYGIVRPQAQFGDSIQQLQRQVAIGPFSSFGDTTAEQPSITGHAFGFQNQSLYYQNQYYAGNFGLGRTGGSGGTAFGSRAGLPGGQPLGAVPAPRR
ncbi:hypothetical protein [Frigoriglobus tundricola]|uniref:Uncharacterized protein n=1 Tax=Frigoriglobus tundricola TaxID=2774151 RepID=A0A6M5Z0I6_9BACT|nr:hypothetical protein [Frigoriglobus tundricola]QJW99695.1 hypothetical protein FTUN_7316 [Frigoriglobus tundricola]